MHVDLIKLTIIFFLLGESRNRWYSWSMQVFSIHANQTQLRSNQRLTASPLNLPRSRLLKHNSDGCIFIIHNFF